MRKIKENLLHVITSLMCVIVLFGCISINPKAEESADSTMPVKSLRFEDDTFSFKAGAPGYYSYIFAHEYSDGTEGIFESGKNYTYGVSPSGTSIHNAYNRLGKKVVYVIWSPEPVPDSYYWLSDYKSNPNCIITSISANITKRMPKPQNVKCEEVMVNGKKNYKVSWKHDKCRRMVKTSYSGYYNIYQDYLYIPFDRVGKQIEVRTITNKSGEYANSEPVIIDFSATSNTGDKPGSNPSDTEKPSEEIKDNSGKDESKQNSTQEESKASSVNDTETAVPANVEQAQTVDSNLKSTKFTKIKAGKKSVTVTWKKQTKNVKGYEIQYSTDKNFKNGVKSVIVRKAKTTSKTIKKLKAGKKYYFRIRTYNKSGSGKVYSNWSKTKKVKVESLKKSL